jgi:hypothetical protein
MARAEPEPEAGVSWWQWMGGQAAAVEGRQSVGVVGAGEGGEQGRDEVKPETQSRPGPQELGPEPEPEPELELEEVEEEAVHVRKQLSEQQKAATRIQAVQRGKRVRQQPRSAAEDALKAQSSEVTENSETAAGDGEAPSPSPSPSPDLEPLPEPEPEPEPDAGSNRYCRICYEADRPGDKLFSPCLCKGSCQFIHVSCLNTWRHQYEPSHRNFTECDLCHYKYRLYRPMISRILLSPHLLLLASAVATGLFTIVCGAVAIKMRRVATYVPATHSASLAGRREARPLPRWFGRHHSDVCNSKRDAVLWLQMVRGQEKPTASCGALNPADSLASA